MPQTATALPLSTAAKLAGVDKSTLRRAVKAGKLSAVRDEHGVWRIEACEVGRLYPLAAPGEQRTAAAPEALPRHAPSDSAPAAVDALVAELRGALADMREDRDHWRGMAERLSLPVPKPDKPASWWPWRRSTA